MVEDNRQSTRPQPVVRPIFLAEHADSTPEQYQDSENEDGFSGPVQTVKEENKV